MMKSMGNLNIATAGTVGENNTSAQNGFEEILQRASSLQELGLLDKAIVEYESLLATDCLPSKIIPGMVACLLKTHSPSKIIHKIDEMVHGLKLSGLRIAQINFVLGLENERRGQGDLALEMYRSALEADPKNKKIEQKIEQLVSKLYSGSRYDYLLRNKRVTSDQLRTALSLSKKTKKSVEHLLIEQFNVPKKEVGKSLSLYYKCPFRSFDPKTEVPVELIGNLKKSFLLHDSWVPMSWGKNGVEILIDDPGDLRKTGQIRGLTKTTRIIFSVGLREDIEKYVLHFFDKKAESSAEDMISELDMIPDIDFEEEDDDSQEDEDYFLNEESSQVVRLVDQVIINAYRNDASDIHIEPSPESRKTVIRFRMDGVCQEYAQVPEHMARGILSRLKIMAGLDIAERRLPQDGKIKFRRKGVKPFELRIATIPTAGGREDAVLRVLASAGAMAFSDMGLSERNMKIMERILEQPYGMILVVGPTGSGKTTTLHSALGRINKPGIKIWTAEDPVEITQAGLRQVEAKPKIGLDFARIMRSFLRADPDVIMIGEMRDFETASIGIEASLTGHLVFSTLHTNSAPETVTRLLDMGLNPLNFSDSLLGVLAQRLLRRLCPKCKKKYHPSQEEFEEIVSEYGREAFEKTNIEYSSDLTLYRPWKCDVCAGTGYKGRMGIHELLDGTPEIKKLIKKKANSEKIFEVSASQGMTTLKQDGILKAFSGLTDMGEVRRVCIN
jgi:type II secretory ATPase GspE/PulE/Tfp pilus assembly ATPase PilB-like protein